MSRISSPTDFRAAAKAKLPPFLFHYIDGGAGTESTLRANREDLAAITLRQRVLKGTETLDLKTTLFGQVFDLPLVLAPVGLTGMYARRGEVQAAKAAKSAHIPTTLSTVSVCSLEEVAPHAGECLWFQLYVLKDRGFMKNVLERAKALGVKTLVFTVDMPVPGARYRDVHSGMSGEFAEFRRLIQAVTHPAWAFDVGLMGHPHDLGNISAYRGQKTGLKDYMGYLAANFDPGIGWKDLEWIRECWDGALVIKGILDPEDARDAVRLGADGIVVSNHGGRQLDGASSSIKALPTIADAVSDQLTILADGGVQTGLDVARMLASGAKAVMIGRAYIYALAAGGEQGVRKLIALLEKDLRTTMVLTGARSVAELDRSILNYQHPET